MGVMCCVVCRATKQALFFVSKPDYPVVFKSVLLTDTLDVELQAPR